jgi:DNA-binding transcriptional LysR family regulator
LWHKIASRYLSAREPGLSDDMDLRQLRNALAVLEQGSMGKASEWLGISQPALTKSIHRLEDELQVKLFERNARGMRPTVYGECLRSHARSLSTGLNDLKADLQALKSGARGIVEIGAPPIVAPEVFSGAVNRFLKETPEVFVRVSTELSPQLIQAVQTGRLDFAVTFLTSGIAPAGCMQRLLFDDRLVVAARAGHPVTKTKKTSVRSLQGCSWILPHKDNLHRKRLELAFEAEGMPLPEPVMECNSMPFLKAALLETDCVSLVSRLSVKSEERTGAIKTAELDSEFMQRPIGITWSTDRDLSMAARKLMAIVEKVNRVAR